MSRTFEVTIDALSKISGYGWDFLVDHFVIAVEDGEYDRDYFIGVTAERDWSVLSPLDLRPEERLLFQQIGERGWMRLANPALAYSLV